MEYNNRTKEYAKSFENYSGNDLIFKYVEITNEDITDENPDMYDINNISGKYGLSLAIKPTGKFKLYYDNHGVKIDINGNATFNTNNIFLNINESNASKYTNDNIINAINIYDNL